MNHAPRPPSSPAGLGLLLALTATACPPGGLRLSGPPPKLQPEQEEIYPVGGYEVLGGLWDTTRREGPRERRLRLLVQVEGQRLRGAAPPAAGDQATHNVRIDCQVQHRTCIGTWYDNNGAGNLTWRLGTDFASFTGHYEGERAGVSVGSQPWTGALIQR